MSFYELIDSEKHQVPIWLACELLGVTPRGFTSGSPARRRVGRPSNGWLLEKIKEIHQVSRGVYGAPRTMPSC